MRGSASDAVDARHLLAAIDHRSAVVLGGVNVASKTNDAWWYAHGPAEAGPPWSPDAAPNAVPQSRSVPHWPRAPQT